MRKNKLGLIGKVALLGTALLATGPACAIKEIRKPKVDDLELSRLIEEISTPDGAQDWVCSNITYTSDKENYGVSEFWASPEKTISERKGDCDDYAFAIAAFLSDEGYLPYFLLLTQRGDDVEGHMVFVYKQDGKYGSAGTTFCDYRDPKHYSINSLVESLARDVYYYSGSGYTVVQKIEWDLGGIYTLDKDSDWMTTDKNLKNYCKEITELTEKEKE